jgi:hypothetical protein
MLAILLLLNAQNITNALHANAVQPLYYSLIGMDNQCNAMQSPVYAIVQDLRLPEINKKRDKPA